MFHKFLSKKLSRSMVTPTSFRGKKYYNQLLPSFQSTMLLLFNATLHKPYLLPPPRSLPTPKKQYIGMSTTHLTRHLFRGDNFIVDILCRSNFFNDLWSFVYLSSNNTELSYLCWIYWLSSESLSYVFEFCLNKVLFFLSCRVQMYCSLHFKFRKQVTTFKYATW